MAANTYDHILTKGPESALPSTYEEGKLRFTTDTGRMFVDNQNGRVEVTDFVKGLTEAEIKAQLAPLASKIYVSSDTNKFLYYNTTNGWTYIKSAEADYAASAGTAAYAANSGTVNGKTVAVNVPSDAKFTDTTYTGNNGISLSGTTFSNSGVRSIATGGSNGTINVNTNGTTANVAVKGLGSAAYTASTDYEPTGGTSTGNKTFKVGGNLELRTDAEGGNINIKSPNNMQFEIDAYENIFRVWSDKSGSNKFLTWDGNENVHLNNINQLQSGLSNVRNDVKLNTQDLTTLSRSKNILNMTVENIKKWNTSGTWNGNTYSVGNLTITLLTDDDNNVIGIKSSGTNSGYFNFHIGYSVFKPGTYTLTHATDTPSYQDIYSSTFGGGDNWANAYHSATFTVPSEQTNSTILVYRNFNATDNVVYPMIRLASEEDSTFVPHVPSVNSKIDTIGSLYSFVLSTKHIVLGSLQTGTVEFALTDFQVPAGYYLEHDHALITAIGNWGISPTYTICNNTGTTYISTESPLIVTISMPTTGGNVDVRVTCMIPIHKAV